MAEGLFLPFSVSLGQSSQQRVSVGQKYLLLSGKRNALLKIGSTKVFLYSSCLSVVMVFLTSYSLLVKLGDSVRLLPCLRV